MHLIRSFIVIILFYQLGTGGHSQKAKACFEVFAHSLGA